MPKLTRKEKLKIAKAVKILKGAKKKKRAKKFIDKSHRQNVNIKIGDYSTGGKSVPAAVSHTPSVIYNHPATPSQWAQVQPAPALAPLHRPVMRGPSFQPSPFIPRNLSTESTGSGHTLFSGRTVPIPVEATPISALKENFIGDKRAFAGTEWEFQARFNPMKPKGGWETDDAHDQIGLSAPTRFPDLTTPPQASPELETVGLEYTPYATAHAYDSDEEIDEEREIPTVKDTPSHKAHRMREEEGDEDAVTIRPRARSGRPRLSDEQKVERARQREIDKHKELVASLGGKPGSNKTIDSMFLKKAN